MDHCYSTVSRAYHAIPQDALGHIMVHLIPAYRQKLKLYKPFVRTWKQWTSEVSLTDVMGHKSWQQQACPSRVQHFLCPLETLPLSFSVFSVCLFLFLSNAALKAL